MAENEKKSANTPDGISSITDEEAITEIDIGSFLDNSKNDAPINGGLQDDIKVTEQSLEDEIQSLMDSIMNSGPAVPVPEVSDGSEDGGSADSKMDGLWMNPEDYIEVPEIKQSPSETELDPTPVSDVEKDDLFNMIDSLKSDTDGETGYDDLIADIESNENFEPVNIETDDISNLSEGYVSETETETESGPAENDDEIDINSAEFDSQLAALLGDEKPEPDSSSAPVQEEIPDSNAAAVPEEKEPFKVTIEEEAEPEVFTPVTIPPAVTPSPVQETAAPIYDILPQTGKRTVGNIPLEIVEDDGKVSHKEKKQARADAKIAAGKNPNTGEIIRKIVLTISIIVIIVSSGVLVNTYIIEPYRFKKHQSQIADIITENVNEDEDITATAKDSGEKIVYPEGMLAKYRKLYAINKDISGWISIPGLEINLPIAKGKDNNYYLRRNIYGKWTNYGVPFFDYRMTDLKNLPRNTVVYGHNMHYDDLIFGMMENYREISGFKQAPVIECNTIYADYKWLVYAAFITNSTESQDNGYMLQYNFLDISQNKFDEYIKEIDKRKFYTTGVDIQSTDKILTLSTCCYDFDGARLVIIARLQRDGESLSVDTSKAVKNENPKYPQAWYNANKKTNPYVDDTKWYPNS